MTKKWKAYLGGHKSIGTGGSKFTGWGSRRHKKLSGYGLLDMAPPVPENIEPVLIKRDDAEAYATGSKRMALIRARKNAKR